MIKLVKTPPLVSRLYPKRIWAFPRSKKNIYLTFDDGPHEEITPWVLDQLKSFDAKATFFCVGENVRKNPEIFKLISKEKHSIGNHTYNHIDGSNINSSFYFQNTLKTQKEFETILPKEKLISKRIGKHLFRPPYGKIKREQAKNIENSGFKIVMWDVISYDFDPEVSPEQCLDNVLKSIKNGSIVVMHDSIKAEKNLRYVLPKLLQNLTEKGYKMKAI